MEKTAVQQLFSMLQEDQPELFNVHTAKGKEFVNKYHPILEVEKQQIKDAFLDGKVNWLQKSDPMSKVTEIASEDYYQEKFNSK